MELRGYQTKCIDKVKNLLLLDISKVNKYVVMPTGTGKTEVFKNITDKKILVLEKSLELVRQTGFRFSEISEDVLLIGDGKHLTDSILANSTSKIVVSTIQTLIKDLNNFAVDSFDLVVIDECHHTENDQRYKEIVDHLNYKLCLGFTATPSKKSLIFGKEDKLYELSIFEAWNDNWLMKPNCYTVSLGWDMSKLKDCCSESVRFTWRDEDIEAALSTNLTDNFELILKSLREIAGLERCGVIFPRVKSAKAFADYCKTKYNITCYVITGDTTKEEREQYINEFRTNRSVMLASVRVLTEGVDIPEWETIFNTCPTKSMNNAKQTYGRVLRLAPNKTKCNIIDAIVESSGYLFQHTFETCYFDLPVDVERIKISKALLDALKDIVKSEKDIQSLANKIEEYKDIFYNLYKQFHVYYDTSDIISYFRLPGSQTKLGGYGQISYYNIDKCCYEDSKFDNKIYYCINEDTHRLVGSAGHSNKFNMTFSSNEECFAYLKNMAEQIAEDRCKKCSWLSPKINWNNTGGNKVTNRQREFIRNLGVVPPTFADALLDNVSGKEASIIISRFIALDKINKYCLELV